MEHFSRGAAVNAPAPRNLTVRPQGKHAFRQDLHFRSERALQRHWALGGAEHPFIQRRTLHAAMSDDDDEAGGKPRPKFGLWRSPETKLEQASTDTGKEEEELLEKLDLQRHGEDGNDVPATYGTIDFVTDRNNDAPARFMVVSSCTEPQSICKVMTDVWHLARPSAILSVTGGAASLVIDAQLEAAYVKGLANAAQSTRSWIITGGADEGVMGLTGKVLSSAHPDPHPSPKPLPHPHRRPHPRPHPHPDQGDGLAGGGHALHRHRAVGRAHVQGQVRQGARAGPTHAHGHWHHAAVPCPQRQQKE